jgi:hypothetical protein
MPPQVTAYSLVAHWSWQVLYPYDRPHVVVAGQVIVSSDMHSQPPVGPSHEMSAREARQPPGPASFRLAGQPHAGTPASAAGHVSHRQVGPQIRSDGLSDVQPAGQTDVSAGQKIGRATQPPE